jgi:hypothetical protein
VRSAGSNLLTGYGDTMTVIGRVRMVLVRHAMPAVDPAVPAEQWQLGPDGRAATRTLMPLVVRPAYYVASTEPKAMQTLQEIAGHADVMTDAGLAEVCRPRVWSGNSSYRTTARSYVEGVCPENHTTRSSVASTTPSSAMRQPPPPRPGRWSSVPTGWP